MLCSNVNNIKSVLLYYIRYLNSKYVLFITKNQKYSCHNAVPIINNPTGSDLSL